MRFIRIPTLEIILPSTAGPNDPQTIIGPVIRAALTTYFSSIPATVISNIIFQKDLNQWIFYALVDDGTFVFLSIGTYEAGVVTESSRTFVSSSQATLDFVGPVHFHSNSSLEIDSGIPYSIDAISAPRGSRGANYWDGGFIATSTGAEVAVTGWDVEPTYDFISGRMYKVIINITIGGNDAAVTIGLVRLRQGSETTGGTELCRWLYTVPAGVAVFSGTLTGWFYNFAGNSNISTELSLTNDWIAGTTSSAFYGDADRPLIMAIEDIGIATEQPGLDQVNSLT